MSDARKSVPALKIATAPQLWHGIKYTENVKGVDKRKVHATVKVRDVTWPQVVSALSKLKTAAKKELCPYFVFASFADKAENGEMHRRNNGVEAFYGVVLDIDTPDAPAPEDIRSRLEAEGLAYVVYTTFSYDPLTPGKENKFRVVVPYAEPVAPRDQPFVVLGFAELLGVAQTYDECSKVASQPMYWHSAPAERVDEAMFWSRVDGEPLDPEGCITLGKMLAGSNPGRSYSVSPADMKPGVQFEAGERHNQFVGFMRWQKDNGESLENIMVQIEAMNDKLDEPLDEEQLEGLRRVWVSFERNNNAFGFEHHRSAIMSSPLESKEVYDAVMAQLANSKDKINSAERAELFNLIKQRRGVTLKSVQEHYKELTEEVVARDAAELNEVRERVDKMLKRHLQKYVWILSDDSLIDLEDGTPRPKSAFKNLIAELYDQCAERVGFAVFAELKLGREYAFDKRLLLTASAKGYHPGKPENDVYEYKDVKYLNRYRVPRGEITKGNVKPLLKHLEYLIPNKAERDWFISMIAYTYQQPGKLIKYMFIIEGGKGIGKSILRERVFAAIFGESNVQEVTAEMLVDDKKGWISNAHVDVFEEFKFPTKRDGGDTVYNFLKKYTANPNVQRRAMQKDYQEVPNFSLKVAFRNPEDRMQLEPGDRRYVMVEGPKRQLERAYYDELCDWLDEEENKAAIRYFFKHWDWRNTPFDPNEPLKTAATKEMEMQNDSWPHCAIARALDQPNNPFDVTSPLMYESDLISITRAFSTISQYEQRLAEQLSGGDAHTRRNFANTLESMGFTRLGGGTALESRFRRTGKHGVQFWDRVWLMPGLTVKEIKEYATGFHWTAYSDDLDDFHIEARHFVSLYKQWQNEVEGSESGQWEG